MPNPFNELLAGLSGGFLGYGQQQQQQQQQARLNLQDQRQARLDQQNAAASASQRALQAAQIQNFQSENAQRTAQTTRADAETKIRGLVNQRAFNALAKMAPQHALVQAGYDDNTDYTGELKAVLNPPTQLMQTDQGLVRVPVQGPAGPVMGANGTALGKPQTAPPQITPYQRAALAQRQAQIDAQNKQRSAAAAKPTPDQIKSSTVNDIAGPAADALMAYHGGNGGARQMTAAAASHLPLVGNYLEGKVDSGYQNAMNNARTLATQYLEIMPKSRFQPSTVDDIMTQIAPNVGDAPSTRIAKLNRVKTLKAAIAKRAVLRPDAPDIPLDDIPDPPGVDQP